MDLGRGGGALGRGREDGRSGRVRVAPRPITVLTAVLVLVGTGAGLAVAALSPEPGQHAGILAGLLVAAGFAASEVCVVHLHIRGSSHSFSMTEIPLVVGLFLVAPGVLVLAASIGAALALLLHRRQSAMKVVYNTAKQATEIGMAVAIFRALGGSAGVPDVGPALAAMAATSASTVAGATLVALAITASERSWRGTGLRHRLPMSVLGGLLATCLGLVSVIVIEAAPSMVWLLAVPAAGCYRVYWAWTTQSRRMESLRFLYRTTQALQANRSANEALLGLLEETRELLGAGGVEVAYRASAGDGYVRARCSSTGDRSVERSEDATLEPLLARLDPAHEAGLVSGGGTGPLSRWFGQERPGAGIVAPLTVSGELVGAFVVSPPLNDARTFGEDDRRLVDTTARAVSVALENGSLERSLDQLRALEEKLVHLAYHDPLTHLPNRSRFIERTAEMAAADTDRDGEFALLLIDLDDFKTVNDSLGHDAGDALLVEAGGRIEGCLRSCDLAARLGGDEFAVLLHPVDGHADAEAVAARILATLSQPLTIAGRSLRVSASIGVAVGGPGSDVTDLLKSADVAMYEAKAAGKGQAASFQTAMHRDTISRYQLLQDVQFARERGELSVEYQPIVGLATGQVECAEALIRWDHPTEGRISAAVLVELAEENRAIGEITDLVLRDACRQLARHGAETLPRVSINVSSRDLRSDEFAAAVAGALAESGVAPDRLVCEVTESLLLEEKAAEVLGSLRALGVAIALDDFGTGYSSLQRLRRLPLDQVKVAKPFVDDLGLDPDAAAFVRAITALAKTLGLIVVAEGVERPEQVAELVAAGCDSAQGFLFARPAPIDVLMAGRAAAPARAAAR